MNTIRLGLCCLFHKQPIKFRSTTIAYLQRLKERGEDPWLHLDRLVSHNGEALEQAIRTCARLGIGDFRINSRFLPAATFPEFAYQISDLPSGKTILTQLTKCRQLAQELNIRLTFHPDQFIIINSPRDDVVERSLAELEMHGQLAELTGADVINIHAGGDYGNPKEALHRFATNFARLSPQVQSRLTLENDDKLYSPEQLLPLCHELGISFVYDVHHHRCLPDQLTVEQATDAALATWNCEPLFHLSSPKGGWDCPNPAHHDWSINPADFPTYWFEIGPLTVEVEAKGKEEAILQLKQQLPDL